MTMRKILLSIIVAAYALGTCVAVGQEVDMGSFEQVKTKTFDKEKFIFPDDVRGTQLNIFFLAMGADRDAGEAQQLALIDWHEALAARGVFSDDNCGVCHGTGGRGPALAELKALSSAERRDRIRNHPIAGQIPQRLPAHQLSDVIEFLEPE